MEGKIIVVSLGPGDPGLVTLKALKALQEVDWIYCPGTCITQGSVKSRALAILRSLSIPSEKIRCFQVPMDRNRKKALETYDRVCEEMAGKAEKGDSIALTAEGDACFYSSANYMFEKLRSLGYSLDMLAGVPAFIAAGTSVGLSLVKQQERLSIIPGDVDEEELQEELKKKHALVIMKVPLGEAVIRSFVATHRSYRYYYFEQVGTPDEFYTSEVTEILARPFTYFSILVIKNE